MSLCLSPSPWWGLLRGGNSFWGDVGRKLKLVWRPRDYPYKLLSRADKVYGLYFIGCFVIFNIINYEHIELGLVHLCVGLNHKC